MSTCEERIRAAQDKQAQRNRMMMKAKAMLKNGYTNAKIAVELGVTEGTVRNLVKGL